MDTMHSYNAKRLLRIALGVLVTAGLLWRFWPQPDRASAEGAAHDHGGAAAEVAAGDKTKVRLWICPMNDTPPKTGPGNCPVCGMKLVPMPDDQMEGDHSQPVLTMSQAARKLAEVEVAPVRKGFAEVALRLAGKVGYDETRERVISAWVPGRLEKVFVDNTGTVVNKGDPLVEIYSQKLNGEKAIYLSTLKDKPLGSESPEKRRQLNRARLLLMGLTEEQIDAIEKRPQMQYTEKILAPISGTVVEKQAQEGMYVNEGQMLYRVADLSRVWVWLEAYESDLPFIRYGQDAEIRANAYDNETFRGMVSFIEPVLNDVTRTARVRVQVDNTELMLKPNMIVRAVINVRVGADGGIVPPDRLRGKWVCPRHPEVIRDQPGRCEESGLALLSTEALGYVTEREPRPALLVPASAVLVTGKRGYVYRADEKDGMMTFTGVEIGLGPRAEDDYVIRSGLQEGEKVAVNGAFRIDSALQLANRPSMMRPAADEPADGANAAEGAASMPSGMTMPGSAQTTPVSAGQTVAVPVATQDGRDAPVNLLAKTPEAFRTDLVELLKQYFLVQRALGEDEREKAGQEVVKLAALCKEVNAAGLTPAQKSYWDTAADRVAGLAASYAKGKDIEEQRTVFSPLSAVMEDLVRASAPLPGLEVYRAFCPMAFGNNGAFWLQEGKIIHNPYEGGRMLKCGSIKEQLSGQTTGR